MATIQKTNESYRILFRYRGKRHTLKLGKVSRDEAESKANQIDYLLMRIKQKLLVVPPAVSIKDFMLHDGRFSDPVDNEPATQQISFGEFRDKYLSTHRNGALEQNSLGTLEIHLRHIATHNILKGGSQRVHWVRRIENYSVDLLLVQESNAHHEHLPPLLYPDAKRQSAWEMIEQNGWGSAVFSRTGLVRPLSVPGFSG